MPPTLPLKDGLNVTSDTQPGAKKANCLPPLSPIDCEVQSVPNLLKLGNQKQQVIVSEVLLSTLDCLTRRICGGACTLRRQGSHHALLSRLSELSITETQANQHKREADDGQPSRKSPCGCRESESYRRQAVSNRYGLEP